MIDNRGSMIGTDNDRNRQTMMEDGWTMMTMDKELWTMDGQLLKMDRQ